MVTKPRLAEASGMAIGLIGSGVLYIWPDKAPLGYGTVAAGVLIFLLSLVWEVSRYLAIKEFQGRERVLGDSPTQALSQYVPITNVFAPNLNPQQSPQQAPTPESQKTAPAYLDPELELLGAQLDVVSKDDWGVFSRANRDFPGDLYSAAFLDFYMRPLRGCVPWVEIRAQVIFKDGTEQVIRVNEGIWLDDQASKKPFRRGETHSLIIASLFPGEDFHTYEHRMRDPGRALIQPFLYPVERSISGETLRVQVHLVGEYMDEPVFDKYWCVKLSKDQSEIEIITPQQFSDPPPKTLETKPLDHQQ